MRVTVLGSNGTYPTPGSPTSGYLVEHDDTKIWTDAGSGTFAALQAVCDPWDLDAVILTHEHSDHCLDVLGFHYALRYGERPFAAVPTYAPDSVRQRLLAFLGRSEHPLTDVLDFRPVAGGDRVTVGAFDLVFANASHPVPTVAVRFEAGDATLVYSSDTGCSDEVERLAKGADLFMVEASYQGRTKPWEHHLTAYEAGEMGERAGVASLLLTHLWPTLDKDISRAEAEATFGRSVEMAKPNLSIEL